MFSEISFNDPEHVFDYKIEYAEINKCTRICVTHTSDFFKWSKTIANDLTESTSEHIKITLTPKDIYNIFNGYHNNSLSGNYKIILPDKCKHEAHPLSIEIHIRFEHNDEIDTKIITLEPELMPFEQRFKLQLEQRDKQFELMLKKRDEQLEELTTEIRMLRSQTKTKKATSKTNSTNIKKDTSKKFVKAETITNVENCDVVTAIKEFLTQHNFDPINVDETLSIKERYDYLKEIFDQLCDVECIVEATRVEYIKLMNTLYEQLSKCDETIESNDHDVHNAYNKFQMSTKRQSTISKKYKGYADEDFWQRLHLYFHPKDIRSHVDI